MWQKAPKLLKWFVNEQSTHKRFRCSEHKSEATFTYHTFHNVGCRKSFLTDFKKLYGYFCKFHPLKGHKFKDQNKKKTDRFVSLYSSVCVISLLVKIGVLGKALFTVSNISRALSKCQRLDIMLLQYVQTFTITLIQKGHSRRIHAQDICKSAHILILEMR